MSLWRPLLVDRISMTVVIGGKTLSDQAQAQLYKFETKQAEFLPLGKINVVQEKYLKRLDYYAAFGKTKAKNRKIADIKVGRNLSFKDKTSIHRYFSLTLFPSQFRPGEFKKFKELLGISMPEFNYEKLYCKSHVNYLELAADSLSHKAHTFLPFRKGCRASSINKDDGLGTTYLGSLKSKLFFRLYDKTRQLKKKSKPLTFKHLPHTRIEAVMRRLGVAPSELLNIDNPFLKISMADIQKAEGLSQDAAWQAFLVRCRSDGVPTALAEFSEHRKKYLKRLDSIQVKWWEPENLWGGLKSALKVLQP